MNNNDERDSAEERYNAELLRNPDGEPEESYPEHGPDDEAIIVTAGEYWDHYGSDDQDDILTTIQHAAIRRAITLFREHTGEEPVPPGIWLTGDQLREWAGLGRYLTANEVAALDECIPNSSIPDAISTIVTEALGLTGPDDDYDPELTGSESPAAEF